MGRRILFFLRDKHPWKKFTKKNGGFRILSDSRNQEKINNDIKYILIIDIA